MTSLIIKVVLEIAALAAALWLSKLGLQWLQRWQTAVDKKQDADDKSAAVTQNQKDNAESDKLKEIDGR